MKKVILSSIFAGVATLAIASLASGSPAMLDQRLKAQDPAEKVQASEQTTSRSVLESLSNKKMMSEKELREFAVATKSFQLDSIIGAGNDGTELLTRQYFTYDAKKFPIRRVNSYWNAATKQWDPAEYYNYIWDEDGYCLMADVYNDQSGQRYEYQYNDRHLGIMQIQSVYANGVWTPQQRGDYKYDDNGNITEEIISEWIPATSEWKQLVKNTAVWDHLNRQTEFAHYEWNGTEWIGTGEKKIFQYYGDRNDMYTLNGWYIWDETTKDWFWYMKRYFEWNEKNQCTANGDQYFNKDTNDWDGCYEWYGKKMYNKRTVINYDAKYRITDETYSECHEIGADYTPMSDIIRTWTDLPDGGAKEIVDTRVLRNNREPWDENIVKQDSVLKIYDANGNVTFDEEWHIRGVSGPLYRYQKKEMTYDANGFLASERMYTQNRQNDEEWLPASGGDYVNDKDGNVLEHSTLRWDRNDNNWVNGNRFVNKYDHGIQTEQLAYRWSGTDWTPNWGTGQFYDFDVPVNDLVLWPGGDFIYKLDEVRSYTGAGNEWVYMANVYHYSKVNDPNGIEGIAADSNIRIGYANQTVTVEGEGELMTNIYDTAGRCIVSTNESSIDLSAYPAGLYIVKAGDASKKIVK